MQLFHWHSNALKQYTTGDLLAMAPDVERARELVRGEALRWLREHRSWCLDADGNRDPNDPEDFDEWWAKLECDLAAEPSTEPVWLIIGGE